MINRGCALPRGGNDELGLPGRLTAGAGRPDNYISPLNTAPKGTFKPRMIQGRIGTSVEVRSGDA